jgi:hypothetical protein
MAVISEEDREFILKLQIGNICKILDGDIQYITGYDKNNEWKKIVIEYDHRKRD